jgi:predicted nucleic acid-binding protein
VTADPSYLVDTGVFILYFRGDRRAIDFFRATGEAIYYSRVMRKELLRFPISSREREEILAFLQTHRLINPDPQIAEGFSSLLQQYPYLEDHLADALIAATAWKKNLEVVTTNPRHFEPVTELRVRRFPESFGG